MRSRGEQISPLVMRPGILNRSRAVSQLGVLKKIGRYLRLSTSLRCPFASLAKKRRKVAIRPGYIIYSVSSFRVGSWTDGEWFGVDHLDVERLLAEWRWLCSKPTTLIARNAFAFYSAIP